MNRQGMAYYEERELKGTKYSYLEGDFGDRRVAFVFVDPSVTKEERDDISDWIGSGVTIHWLEPPVFLD